MTNDEAIKWFKNRYDNSPMHGTKMAFRMAIEALKAQNLVNEKPDLVNDLVNDVPDTNVGDMVSRKAVLDAIGEEPKVKFGLFKNYKEGRNDQWFDDVSAIVRLPSAQPEKRTEECTETHACDLISRQAVIDVINILYAEHRYKIPGKGETYSQYNEAWQDALARVEGDVFQLPPTELEIIRCKDCKHWGKRGLCEKWDHYISNEDFFCGCAERRTDG